MRGRDSGGEGERGEEKERWRGRRGGDRGEERKRAEDKER